ncbi:MAG: DUF5666 domain-containing protein [Candidatus Omnitrophota bacterium]
MFPSKRPPVFLIALTVSLLILSGRCRGEAGWPALADEWRRNMDFVYGQVRAIDGITGSLIVAHYDYEALAERNTPVFLDEATVWDGASGITDLKIDDWVGVNYFIREDGDLIADSVRVDRKTRTP